MTCIRRSVGACGEAEYHACMGWFRRRRQGPPTPEELLAEGHGQNAAPAGGTPRPASDGSTSGFRMEVKDVFSITGRGVVVTGTVEAGDVVARSRVEVWRGDVVVGSYEVLGVEMARKRKRQASPGDDIGILLKDAQRDEFRSGDVVRPYTDGLG